MAAILMDNYNNKMFKLINKIKWVSRALLKSFWLLAHENITNVLQSIIITISIIPGENIPVWTDDHIPSHVLTPGIELGHIS